MSAANVTSPNAVAREGSPDELGDLGDLRKRAADTSSDAVEVKRYKPGNAAGEPTSQTSAQVAYQTAQAGDNTMGVDGGASVQPVMGTTDGSIAAQGQQNDQDAKMDEEPQPQPQPQPQTHPFAGPRQSNNDGRARLPALRSSLPFLFGYWHLRHLVSILFVFGLFASLSIDSCSGFL